MKYMMTRWILAGMLMVCPARAADNASDSADGVRMEPAAGADARKAVRWDVFEATCTITGEYANPFMDVELNMVFRQGDNQWIIPAFWVGGKTWKARFAPPLLGNYQYRAEGTDKSHTKLGGKEQLLEVTSYQGDNPLLQHGFVRVGADRRHFEHADGTPFFWLGDTWWKCLCKRMTWEGFQELTADRKAKGFSVVQIVCGPYPDEGLFEERWGNEGGLPYKTKDFTVVNPDYFDNADRRIKHLVDNGIVPAIVGGWGRGDCDGMAMAGVDGMKRHWRNLIARFGAYPTVWILGGESGGPQWTEIGRYVQQIDPYHRATTIHPLPPKSARNSLTDEKVVNFNMLQTGHGDWDAARGAIPQVRAAYAQAPPMPVMIGEYCYEGHMQTAFQDVQRYVFWAGFLSGSTGHTYGAAGIWQASVEGNPGVANVYDWTTWHEGMNYPGSTQLGLGKRLLEQYPWQRFEPHPEWAEGDCFAAGIPGEVRFIYQPRRNVYNWNGSVVKGLEPKVNYHVFYFDPATGRRFDKGTVMYAVPSPRPFEGHAKPLLFEDRFEDPDAAAWKDFGTPTRRAGGRLVGGKGMVTVLDKIDGKDLMASADASSDAEAGIILRFHDADNYLVGLYSPTFKSIFLHDRKNGQWGDMLGKVAVPDIGPRIHLAAAVCGDYAALVLTDGKTGCHTPAVRISNITAGRTGLWLFQIGERQEYDNYEVSRASFPAPATAPAYGPGVIDSDTYHAPNLPSPQDWVVVMERAAGVDDFSAATHDDGKGHPLPYRLFIPRDYDESRKYPLILYFHGAGGRGTDNVKQLADVPQIMTFANPANQRQRPCFILAPQCPENVQWVSMPWSEPTGAGKFTAITWPMEASLALLDKLTRQYRGIDPARISVIGPSMGGYGTWDAVCRFPDKFRNAVPICGGGDPGKVSLVPELKHLRLWAFHCADDPAVPVGRSREMIDAMNALNGMPPRYTEYPAGGHDAYTRALTDPELHRWLLEYAGNPARDSIR